MKAIKYVTVGLFFLILFSEEIFKFTPVHQPKNLVGAFTIPRRPKLNFTNLINYKFQDSFIDYFEYGLKYHNTYVRTINQINYNLFNKATAKSIAAGNNGQIFESYHIDSYLGKNYLGKDSIVKVINILSKLQQALEKRNTCLLVLIAPSKASIYPEDIASSYPGYDHKSVSNYDTYIEEFQKQKINYIDFRNYFLFLKKKESHKLFSNFGLHWNGFGTYLAADTLVKYIEKKKGIDMVDLLVEKGVVTKVPRYYDHDLMALLNLIVDKQGDELYYPKITFKHSENKYKPNVLIVGDSYTRSLIFTYPFFQNLFSIESEFWFYNLNVEYRNDTLNPNQENLVRNFDLKQKIENRDYIILLYNEHNFLGFDFDFSKKVSKVLEIK
jgi:hypothetical protein